MYDGIDGILRKGFLQSIDIPEIGLDELTALDKLAMSCGKIIQRHRIVASLQKLFDGVAPDITGSAGDEYLFKTHSLRCALFPDGTGSRILSIRA